MFHDGVDGELQRVKTEMKHMSETIEQNRGKLSDPDTNPAEKQQLAFTLDQTTRSYVRLVRRYEVDMTDDEFDHAMLVLKGKNDQSGAKVLWMKNSI